MILDPDGMFNGDRVAALSQDARLFLVWYMLGSNDYGRLEINYSRIVSRIFARFHEIPIEERVWSHFGEYMEQHLAFVYSAAGQVWAQFDTSEKWLPRYKSKASQASPDPGPAFLEWKSEYSKRKQQVLDAKPIAFTNFKNPTQNFGKVSHGIGVGVGVGVGVGTGSSGAREAAPNAPIQLAADGLPLTLAAAREHFPSVNGRFLTKLAEAVVSIVPREVRDDEVAQAVRLTHRPEQTSPNLWLSTVPDYLVNGAPKPKYALPSFTAQFLGGRR